MADLAGLRADAAALRAAVAAAEDRVHDVDAEAAALAAEFAAAGRRPDAGALAAFTAERAARLAALDDARKALDALIERDVPAAADELAGALDPGVPLLLLPVRIETRLPDRNRLLVRIFPDDVHLEEHEPALTDAEHDQGVRYWTAVWRAGRSEVAAVAQAWDQLVATLGDARAAWVARALTPTVDDRPAAPDAAASPTFPTVRVRGRGRARPARASTLPDRFVALAYQGDRLVGSATGAAVPDSVQVGPDLDAGPGPGAAPGGVPVDARLRWLVDFGEAERVGLAVRVDLEGHDPERAPLLSHVLVLGVSASMDVEGSTARVERLLGGHRDGGAAAFLAQGTPTNNTPRTRRRPAPVPVVEDLLSGADAVPPADPLANAQVAARALGVDPGRLARMPGADDTEQADARAMQLALWTATGEQFVDDLLEDVAHTREAMTPETRNWLRTHVADHVRARGPLPALRIGRQPYGVLPVTSLDRWTPGPDEPAPLAAMHGLLRTVRPFWAAGVGRVPRIGGPDQDGEDLDVPKPARDVLRGLGVAPVSRMVHSRGVRGPANATFLDALLGIQDMFRTGFSLMVDAALGLPRLLGHRPVLSQHQNDARSRRLWLPLALPIGLDMDNPADRDLAVTGLVALLNGVVSRIDPELLRVVPGEARTLLEGMLRHAANIEYAAAATRTAHVFGIVRRAGVPAHEVSLFDMLVPPGFRFGQLRPVALAQRPVPGGTVADILRVDQARLVGLVDAARRGNGRLLGAEQLLPFERPWSARLAELDAGLGYLARRVQGWHEQGVDPFPAVERLLGESLDLVSHRLDAWITSLASARLAAMRGRRARGVTLGAYGWVVDLSPRGAEPRSDGSILAPSLPQATTAAILRSGALAHADPGAYAVDLSSRRMRAAMAVLDGVRAGQPIGALLGYRVERRLHESIPPLDHLVAPLRRLAPLVGVQHPGDGASEFVAARDVVDGARLAELGVPAVLADAGVLAALRDVAERPALEAVMAAVGDDVDGVADLLLAESVHQLACGNPERAGATVEALAAGGQPPPRPQVLDTPRPARPVTHRVLVAVPPDLAPESGWAADARRSRPAALARPRLDAWASRLLGAVDRIRVPVAWTGPDGAVVARGDGPWPLDAECALDVVALAAAGTLADTVAQAIAARRPDGVPDDAVPVIARDRPGGWARRDVSAGEVFGLASALAAAFAVARPATAADLGPADVPLSVGPAGPDGADGPAEVSVVPADAGAVTASLGDGLERGEGDDPVRDWLDRAATVRAGVAALADLLLRADAAGTGRGLALRAGQIPFAPGDRWVGTSDAPAGATGLVVHGAAEPDLSAGVAALVVDAWSEQIPDTVQPAAVALHYDAPGARPPQAVLLAVPPVPGAQWTVDALASVLRETLDLARLRLVDLESLAWLGRYLPAAYLPEGALGTPRLHVEDLPIALDPSRLAQFIRKES